MPRDRVVATGVSRRDQTVPQGYVYDVADDGSYYAPGTTDSPFLNFLNQIPQGIGTWIGRGVNAYKQASTDFERYWNSPLNQMSQYEEAGVNPYEGFLQGSGGNGNPITPDASDPLMSLAGYISNFVALAHGLADLRSKNIANDSSAIDLVRKQFSNKWFFGDPGTTSTEEFTDPDGTTHIVTRRDGYIQPLPEIEYELKRYGRDSSRYRVPGDRYNALKYQSGIDEGLFLEDMQNDVYEKRYRTGRERMSFEWEKFLKDDLGLDPRSSPWLTSFMKFLDNQSKADSPVARVLFGVLQFLKGNY